MNVFKHSGLAMVVLTVLSGCANFDDIREHKESIGTYQSETDKTFSYVKSVDYNYLGDLSNSRYPDGFWALTVNETYAEPVSLSFILDSLASRLAIPVVMDKSMLDMTDKRKFTFSGSVGEYLQFLTETYNVYIDMSADKISAVRTKEKVFVINSPYFSKNKSSYSYGTDSVSKDGGGSGFTGKIDVDIDNDVWKDLDSYLTRFAQADERFKFSFVKELSHVVVDAAPAQMKKVEEFVDKYNSDASTEVKVNYKLISIDEAQLAALSANLSVKEADLLVPSLDLIGSSALGINRVLGNAAVNSGNGVGWGLSAAMLRSGGVLATSGVTVGLNKKPMPINISTETSYVSSLTREVATDTSEAAMTVELSKLEYGLSLIIIPKVIDNKRIGLTIGYSRRELVGIENYGEENMTVQLPTVNKKEMVSDVVVRPNEETLVALFKEDNSAIQDNVDLLAKGMSKKNNAKMMALVMSVQRR